MNEDPIFSTDLAVKGFTKDDQIALYDLIVKLSGTFYTEYIPDPNMTVKEIEPEIARIIDEMHIAELNLNQEKQMLLMKQYLNLQRLLAKNG